MLPFGLVTFCFLKVVSHNNLISDRKIDRRDRDSDGDGGGDGDGR